MTGNQPDNAASNWKEAQEDEAFLATLPGSIRWPHCVVDQNTLRSTTTLAAANGPFLLPDVAIAELFKASSWRFVAQKNLSLLASCPDLAFVSHSVGGLLNSELASGVQTDIIDPVATSTLRAFLKHLARDANSAFSTYGSSISSARALGAAQYFDGPRNKSTVVNVRDAWLGELTSEQLKTLRGPNGQNSPLFAELLSGGVMLKAVTDMLCSAGYPTTTAQSLAFYPSFTGAQCVGLAALALQWVARGGLDNTTSEEVLTNDLADMDYVILSVFCRSYASVEKKMVSMRQMLVLALETLWRENAEVLLKQSKRHAKKPV